MSPVLQRCPVFLLLCEKWSATMSTIEEVRAAEKKLQELVNALRAVRELEPQPAHPGAQNRAA